MRPTHYQNGDVQNGSIDDGNENNVVDIRPSGSVPSSINVGSPYEGGAVATRTDPITDHTKHEYDQDTDVGWIIIIL